MSNPDVAKSPCRHERGHIVDSLLQGNRYATPASRRIFCDICRLQRWLDVEAALALTQGEMGMIPKEVAEEIARAATLDHVDVEQVRDGIARTGHSLVALLQALQAACRDRAGEFVHYGATTQDIQDTAQSLEMTEVLDEVDRELRNILSTLVELAHAHRDTLMIGRSHARPALPMTFGLKVAGWVDELTRQGQRLDGMKPRVLVAQLHGGVGTMAGFDGQGPELVERFAARLLLGAPAMAWHVARDRVAEFVTTLAMIAGTCGRIADEVRTLSRPEFAELELGWTYGKVGSSTMPHKRNPEDCEQVVALAHLARANAMSGLQCMLQEHERDSRGLRIEWATVADVSHHTLAALEILTTVVQAVSVDTEHMADQARDRADEICSEALMLALGQRMGKQTAHGVVYEVTQLARTGGRSVRAVLAERPDVTALLDPGELDGLLDPANHLGSCGAAVDRVLADAGDWLSGQ